MTRNAQATQFHRLKRQASAELKEEIRKLNYEQAVGIGFFRIVPAPEGPVRKIANHKRRKRK